MDKDTFFANGNSKPTDIPLPDGSTVRARKLKQSEVEIMRKKYSADDKALEGFRYVVSQCVLNDDGTRMFEDADMSKLTEVDFDVIRTIAEAVTKHSGLYVPNT